MKNLSSLITEFAMACHAEAQHVAKGGQIPLGKEEEKRKALMDAIAIACLKQGGYTADLELRKLSRQGELCEAGLWPIEDPCSPRNGMSFIYIPPEMARGFTVGDTLRVTVHLELVPKATDD